MVDFIIYRFHLPQQLLIDQQKIKKDLQLRQSIVYGLVNYLEKIEMEEEEGEFHHYSKINNYVKYKF